MKIQVMPLVLGLGFLTLSCEKERNAEKVAWRSSQSDQVEDSELLKQFWGDFRLAVKSGDNAKIASFITIPLVGMEDVYKTTDDLISDFDWVFPEEAKEAIVRSSISDLDFRDHKDGGYWEFTWWNGVDSEGQYTVTYHIAKVRTEFKIVRLLAAG